MRIRSSIRRNVRWKHNQDPQKREFLEVEQADLIVGKSPAAYSPDSISEKLGIGEVQMDQTAPCQRASMLASLYQNHQDLTHCPVTGIDSQGNDWKIFLLPAEGQVFWWHCSACQGWHVLVVDNGKK